ncbi:hypothetical protein [Nonomuraea glycinis]
MGWPRRGPAAGLSLLSRMPRTKERMMARVVTPIHHAANAITVD